MVEHMSERLDLDAEQEQRLDAIFAQMRDLRREAMQSRRDSMIEVASLLEAPNLDQARTLEVFSAKIDSMEQRAPQLIATVAQFTDSLTPEQKQQAKDMLERRFERHGDDLK
jgi:Spy/CpxP family protein refolding chaperone